MRVYRSESYSTPRCTIREVVEYEIEELGNSIHVDQAVLDQCGQLPARNCAWVSASREVAAEYNGGQDISEFELDPPVIIASDNYEGLLVLMLNARHIVSHT